jgi:hypothetical protein
MDITESLSSFNAHVDNYAQHREYIRRALAQAERFSSSIIEKVVLDHSVKASAVADDILPLVPDLEGRIAEIEASKTEINERKANSDEEMEELTLRQAIGEITDDEFEDLTRELRASLDEANGELEELNREQADIQAAIDRWVELAAEAEQPNGLSAAAPVEEEAAEEVVEDGEAEVEDDEVVGDTPVVVDDGATPGQHATKTNLTEDLSDVFQEDEAPVLEAEEHEDAIEAGDAEDGFEVEVDDGEGEDGEGVEIDLSGESDDQDELGDEIGIDLDAALDSAVDEAADEAEAEAEADDTRRALLLYQEGTPDEQIYPFSSDKLTIGRGRDNDIQIKNDSKVSRFHCRLFKRAGNFYIEDNKSSNGTLVNGELITERRLFGGEEIIIGETFFRFRIM